MTSERAVGGSGERSEARSATDRQAGSAASRAGQTGDRLAFERLEIERLPGIERDGFTLNDLSSGVTVVHGPNASGKSSAARAFEQLLWPEHGHGSRRRLRAVLHLGGERWEVELDHDREEWLRDGEPTDRPALPPAHHAERYGLALHDLLAADAGGGAFARRVAEELAGGFDLAVARQRIGAKERPTRPTKRVQEHERALAEVARIEREQRSLEADASRIDALHEDLEEAREAGRRLEAVDAALRWHESVRALASERAELERFPEELEHLAGDELERLDHREAEAREAADDLEALEAKAATARRQREDTGLPPEDGVPEAMLETLRRRAARLAETERELARERSALAESVARRDGARRALGVEGPAEEADARLEGLGPVEWRPLVEVARQAERNRAERQRLDRFAAWLAETERPEPEAVERLREGVRRLRRWLAMPAPGWRYAVPGVVAALLLAGLGGAGLAGALPLGGTLSWMVLGAGTALLGWLWLDRRALARRRRDLAAEDHLGALEPPAAWSDDAVVSTLDVRERRLDRLRLEAEKAALGLGLEEQRRKAERQRAEIEEARSRAAAELGAAPALGDDGDTAPLAAFTEALTRWREAHLDVGARTAACTELDRERRQLAEEIDAGLRPFRAGSAGSSGEPPDGVGGGDEAMSAVEDLRRRAEEHRRATRELAELTGPEGAIATARGRLERKRRDVDALFRAAGLEPGERARLVRLLEERPTYESHRRQVENLGLEADLRAAELPEGEAGEALRGADREALAAERERLAEVAERKDELIRRIEHLETRVGQAERGDALEAALAELERSESALWAAREAEADALVAWELADWVRRSIGRRHQPAVLRGTRDLFASFTRGRYELLEPAGDPPDFRARETETGRVRGLRELSAGTRVQLLLAVRLAFVEHQERGLRLPLVLDETLANADERAARAVIDTLIEIARSGRQVIYLTAQHDEVAKWQAALADHGDAPNATVVDLGRVRRWQTAEERSRSEVRPAAPEPPPEPPPTTGAADAPERREQYARALGVPGLDPWSGPGGVHLWYLVDSPDVLYALLSRDVEHWGQLETLGRASAERLLGGGEEGEERWLRGAARARCLGVLFAAWREGRGKPVDRGVLLASGAVNADTFLDKIAGLARDLDGDAAALVAALRERSDGRTKGFLSKKTEELADYLAEEGFLDDRPRLDPEGLEQRALAALGQEIAAEQLRVGEIRELAAGLPDL